MGRWLDKLKNLPKNELTQLTKLGYVSYDSAEYKVNEKFNENNAIFNDEVERLNVEHLARCKQTEIKYANIKVTSVDLPIWVRKKFLSNMQLEQLKFLLICHSPIIEGCKLHDILEYADPLYDYLSLQDPEMLKLFARLLQENGRIRIVVNY